MDIVVLIALGEEFTAVVAHCLYVYSFVAGGWVAVVNPQEGTDFHFFLRLLQDFVAVGGHEYDFGRPQLVQILISQIDVGKALETETVSENRAFHVLFDANLERSAAHLVTGAVNSFRSGNQHGD